VENKDKKVINDFGEEWKTYNQNNLSYNELKNLYNNYFEIFPFELINENSEGFDMGCGSGRWAQFIASKVKVLNCIEPSNQALMVAKENLKNYNNCIFKNEDVMSNTIKHNSQDFGYCLGVLHHMPDTNLGIENCVKKLKKGAPFLLYLYYRFDGKPYWFRLIWEISNIIRKLISKLPFKVKLYITRLIAVLIYLPLARFSLFMEKLGFDVSNIPISSYRKNSLYTMQTDSLDRFGTRLENRFTKEQIFQMMVSSGLTNIKFSNKIPYWVAVGEKK
jgi:SAM-dependent methyltransferase